MVWIALALSVCSYGYLACALVSVRAFGARLRRGTPATPGRGVTLLKPLCGHDPELLENLRSCCRQDYPSFQIVFGVLDPGDPAARIAQQVIDEHPELDLALVTGGSRTGPNLKISSLVNMQRRARHGFICIADSDMRVQSDYLARIMAPFEDPEVGAVTCLYTGKAMEGLGSRLGAMFVNDWFLPSALVSATMQSLRYCFGATMAVRREVLETIGGIGTLVDYLADDCMLGRRVRAQGYRIALADCVVENLIHEPDILSLVRHELRWARTMRRLEPLGYGLAALTDIVPIAAITGLILYLSTGAAWQALAVLGLALGGRTLLHRTVAAQMRTGNGSSAWLIPFRDLLTALLRLWSYVPGPVTWRGNEFDVDREGRLTPRVSSHGAK